jgi:hypothetical protein
MSFAQFEREVTSERIRDKIAASKRKGLWVGGMAPLGYETKDRKDRKIVGGGRGGGAGSRTGRWTLQIVKRSATKGFEILPNTFAWITFRPRAARLTPVSRP